MSFPPRIALIGYRGSGKSTVGRGLADRLGFDFADSDEIVVRRSGRSIREIFGDLGEPTFRQWEAEVVHALCERERIVLGLGGGAVLSAGTRRLLRNRCTVIWLQASVETLAKRLASDPQSTDQRPALTDTTMIEEIRDVLNDRTPLYQSVADVVVDTEGRRVEEIVTDLVQTLATLRGS